MRKQRKADESADKEQEAKQWREKALAKGRKQVQVRGASRRAGGGPGRPIADQTRPRACTRYDVPLVMRCARCGTL
jgi:hypothetical protein